jgi:endonuclease/exonuclease/phosphatase (EEP) superfamily protein YafD
MENRTTTTTSGNCLEGELQNLKVNCLERWLLVGDFNLIYKVEDKSNGRLNRRLMNRFKQVIDANQLMELDLRGRKFTWSNEQDTPTFTKIDRFFGTPEWHVLFPNVDLQALPTMGSDHCPLFLTGDVARQHYAGFRFESYWVDMPGFLEVIQEVWHQPVNTQDTILKMHVKLIRTSKALKLWKRQNLGNLPLRLAIAKEALLLLDTAQEQRQLTHDELEFRRYLKAKADGLAAIQRTRARQHSRLTWIRKGDACTKMFMLHANNRKRKLHIPLLHTSLGPTNNHQQKEEAVYDHFVSLLGEVQRRSMSLNWTNLG